MSGKDVAPRDDDDDDKGRGRGVGKVDTSPPVVGDAVQLKADLLVTAVNSDGSVEVFSADHLEKRTLPAGTFYKRRKD